MKTIIVGGGIMGLCAAWALVRRGASVTLLEQGPLPNPLGSSVDRHRLIRYPYGAQRGYTRMVHAAYDAWERLWDDLGVNLAMETGTLVVSREGDGWTAACRETLQAEGIAHETLDPAAIAERFPFLETGDIREAFFCPSGGLLRAEAIVAALAEWLKAHRAVLRPKTRVAAIDPAAARVTLADGTTLEADRLLVAAGPWTRELLPALETVARPSRQTVVYLSPPAELLAAWHRAPMLLEIGAAAGFYAVPPRVTKDGMRLGLKIGDHRFGATADPAAQRTPAPHEADAILEAARHRIARLYDYRVAEAKTCFYDVEAEERFQFRSLGPRSFALCGSSGHGFKFGPCLGEQIAAALAGAAAAEAVAAWAAGQLVPAPVEFPRPIMPVPAAESDSSG